MLGHMVTLMFNILRNCKLFFHNGCTNLLSHQQSVTVPISPYATQHLLLSVFFILANLVGVKWYLTVVLICFSVMTNDVELLFMGLLATYIFSLEKCLLKFFAHL